MAENIHVKIVLKESKNKLRNDGKKKGIKGIKKSKVFELTMKYPKSTKWMKQIARKSRDLRILKSNFGSVPVEV